MEVEFEALERSIKRKINHLHDYQRFALLFNMMLNECRGARMTKTKFLDMIHNTLENPAVACDFADAPLDA